MTEVKTRYNKRDGECKEWYDNGQLYQHCYYKDGKRNGEYKSWHDNGQLWIHCYYKDGKLDGEHKWWLDNGHLQEHCYYKDDKLDGEYKWRYDNGHLQEHCYYIDNRLICDQFQQHKNPLLFLRKKLIERLRLKRMKFIQNHLIADLAKLCSAFII